MANHKSAIKRQRQNVKRKARNNRIRTAVRTAIKGTKAAIQNNGEVSEVQALLKKTESLIAKATTKGLFHKKTASRTISRLASEAVRATSN